jgi:sugar-phosphatase
LSVLTIQTKGLLFDMDGVLVNSIDSVNRCWAQWADMYGVDREHALSITHGRRAIDTVRTLRPDIDPQKGLKDIEDIEVLDVDDTKLLPGVIALLNKLPRDRWTIVTSASTRLSTARLIAANVPCPVKMITADDVIVGKPDPEPYRRGAEILGFDVQDCIVVEDAPSGAKAGKAAGSRVLGVVGSHSVEDLLEVTDWCVSSLEDVDVAVEGDLLRLALKAI